MPNGLVKARRFDVGEVSGVEITPQGYLQCDGQITRIGVFTYRDGRGGVRRELRPPEEVFARDSLDSFALSPLTNDHPARKLDAKNTGKFQVGTIANPRAEGEFVAARIQVTDAKTIDQINGGKRELSCGYDVDLEDRPGVTSGIDGIPDGLRFDVIQRNIRANHVALVDVGRAGPEAALRLDADDAVITDDEPGDKPKPRADAPDPGEKPMTQKIKIDGVDFEVSENAAQAFVKFETVHNDLVKASEETRQALEAANARADKAEEDLAVEKKAREDAEDPAKIREAVDARLKLEREAGPILGDEVKLDELDEVAIKRAVVEKTASDKDAIKARLDGCDPAYLNARYDAALEAFVADNAPNEGLLRVKGGSDTNKGGRKDSADDARKRMIENNHKVGREDLKAV